jgi:hypothetical protein
VFQLDTGILSSELPVGGGRSLITSGFPGSHFFAKELFLPDTPVQALTGKDIEFNLSDADYKVYGKVPAHLPSHTQTRHSVAVGLSIFAFAKA